MFIYFFFDFIDAAVIGIKYKDMERKLFSKRDQKNFKIFLSSN